MVEKPYANRSDKDVVNRTLCKLKQWEGAMRTRRYQEALSSCGCQETFQAIIIVLHPIFFYQVERGLIFTRVGEKVCRWYKDGELQLRLLVTAGHIHSIKSWAIHSYMHRRTVRCTRGALQGREVTHAMFVLVRVNSSRIGLGIIGPLETIGKKRGATTIFKLVFVASGGNWIGTEHILAALRVGFSTRVELVQV